MKRFNKSSRYGGSSRIIIATLVLALVSFGFTPPVTVHAATVPDLGIAASYAIFGKAGVGNTGASTHIWGNVGADLLSNITGLIASQVDGSMIGPAAGVQTAITAAYGALNAWGADGGQTLSGTVTINPGVWTVGAALLNGTVTLDGAGVYILRSSSDITVSPGAQVNLINGALPCNVFWQVPNSMTIGVGAHVEGTIITDTSLISLGTNASLVGRAFSSVAAVTLDSNLITEPTCVVPPPAPVQGYSGGGTTFALIPNINITKIPSPLALPLGLGPVTYDYKVTNIGQVPMIDVWVKDDKCSPAEYVSGDTNKDSKLDMSESWTYRCTKTVSKTETNTVIAHGSYSGWNTYDNAIATVVVGVPIVPPLIHLLKTADKYSLPAGGGPVTYSYAVTNPGVAPLSDVSITDDKCTGLPGRVAGHPGDINKNNLLDPGETFYFTCQTNIAQTTTNTATAVGHANGLTAIDYSPVTVVVPPATLTTAPKLPNTGLPPRETSNPWNIAALAGVLMLASVSLVAVLKKRAI